MGMVLEKLICTIGAVATVKRFVLTQFNKIHTTAGGSVKLLFFLFTFADLRNFS